MIEDKKSLNDLVEGRDVAQKRYLMFKVFDELVDRILEEDLEDSEKLSRLEESQGYFYKLSLDFLNSSSTLEKQGKIEKMLEYVERKN